MTDTQGAAVPDRFVGRVIDGRYRVEKLLGEGAVGVVYKALDAKTGNHVAVKIWLEESLDEQTSGRFSREAKALTTLEHPNIVSVYGYGVVDNSPYLAMEMLVGGTLERRLEDGEPLDPAFVMHIGRQMLEALAFAHSRSVVHRDLKPDNIFVVEKPGSLPHVKLLDYGLAKFLTPEEDPVGKALTMTGMVMGTPLYMAPEQAMGGKIDLTADVYSAGCVLFELFTGRLPFLGETHGELLRLHMTAPVPKLGEAAGGKIVVKPEIQAFIERAMAKRAEQRFPNAAEMLQAFVSLPQPAVSKVGAASPAAQRPRAPVASAGHDVAEAPKSGSNRMVLIAVGVVLLLGAIAAVALR